MPVLFLGRFGEMFLYLYASIWLPFLNTTACWKLTWFHC